MPTEKISFRTDEKHRQMVEQGEYRGGTPSYGYKLELSGKYNLRDQKQRKELYNLVIDDEEAKVVRMIYQSVYEFGWGGNRIARHLNEITVALLLIACTEQLEYKDATFGVISLVGEEQALYIDTLLQRYLS